VKEIILDLLGWGVPPDFLLGCGLSKQVIYYVFSELHLTLPEGFDPSGIPPFTPEALAEAQQPVLMPPPPVPEIRTNSVDLGSHTLDLTTRATSVSPKSAFATPPSDSQGFDLLDIERQRKQELIARKAAQASRKMKQSASTDSSTSVIQKEDQVTLTAPTEAVEDFLNSLRSIPPLDTRSTAIILPQSTLADNMDEDDAQYDEDLSTTILQDLDYRTLSPLSENAISPSFTEPPPTSSDALTSSTEAPPTSSSSMSAYSQLSDSELVTPSMARIIPPQPPPSNGTSARRGVKRPVASDFVDFDPAPRRAEINARNEEANGPIRAPLVKRPSSAFLNIGSRRCVIDLSDSEGEEDDTRHQHSVTDDQTWPKRDRRSKAIKYPSPPPAKPATPVGMPPGALLQKELEIRKMRELIAQREEETRLKKLAVCVFLPYTCLYLISNAF